MVPCKRYLFSHRNFEINTCNIGNFLISLLQKNRLFSIWLLFSKSIDQNLVTLKILFFLISIEI